MLKGFFGRIFFAVRHLTLKRIVVVKGESSSILVYHPDGTARLQRRCPHQGGPLEEGTIKGDHLHCSWHGCRFSLTKKNAAESFDPTR